jgi:hypothetical protein
MNERPKSITVVCWFLIISVAFSLIAIPWTINNPITQKIMAQSAIPISLQYAMMFVGLFITLLCSIAMLKRQNWARILYVVWNIIVIIYGIATSPMKAMAIPGLIVILIIAFFLFRPKANEYFKATEVV